MVWKGMPSLTHSAGAANAATATFLTLSQSTPASPDPNLCCSIILCQDRDQHPASSTSATAFYTMQHSVASTSTAQATLVVSRASAASYFVTGIVKTHFTEWIGFSSEKTLLPSRNLFRSPAGGEREPEQTSLKVFL